MKLEGTLIWHYDEEDLKALKIKSIQEDINLLESWGFDFSRNVLQYIHEIAEEIRFCETDEVNSVTLRKDTI